MFEIIKPGTQFNFVGNFKTFGGISAAVVAISLIFILVKGFDYGIDFAGGTEMQISFSKSVKTGDLRSALIEMGFPKQVVASMDNEEGKKYLIRLERYSTLSEDQIAQLERIFTAQFKDKLKKYSYDKESGETLNLDFTSAVDQSEIADALKKGNLQNFNITSIGREGEYKFRIELESFAKGVVAELGKRFNDKEVVVMSLEAVGSEVGEELRTDGLLAAIYAIIGILIYVAFRFEPKYAPGAILSLVHDATITCGLFSILGLEFNMTVLAAILTLIGYSINDTIIVYDRIRENVQRFPETDMGKSINQAINQTLSRTVLTSTLTMLVTVALLAFGGHTLFGFSFALTFGIFVGTYSSIFIAAPLTLIFEKYVQPKKRTSKAKA